MIHGAMAWSGTFRPLMERLSAAGYRAIAIDLPPFGFSERPATHDYDRRAQARRIGALLDALALEDAVLVGHSFGAGASVETAMTRADRVTGLVLLSGALGLAELAASDAAAVPPSPLATPWLRDAMVSTTATNPWATGAVLRSMMANDVVVTDARVAIYQQPFGVEGLTPGVGRWIASGLFADEHAATSAVEGAYRTYAPRVLMVWGREDTVTPLAQATSLAEWLPNDELVVLDHVGHIPHVEDLDGVASALLEWLAAPPRP